MKLSNYSKSIVIVLPSIMLIGCKTPPTTEGCTNPAVALTCTKLTIADTVSTSTRYPAVMSCSNIKEVKILSGDFYWNGEGPFNYKYSRLNSKTGEVGFNLRTGNPGSYEIKGEISYRDAIGCEHKTKRVSAGRIRAK